MHNAHSCREDTQTTESPILITQKELTQVFPETEGILCTVHYDTKNQVSSAQNVIRQEESKRALVKKSQHCAPVVNIPPVSVDSNMISKIRSSKALMQDQQHFIESDGSLHRDVQSKYPHEKVMHCTNEDFDKSVGQLSLLLQSFSLEQTQFIQKERLKLENVNRMKQGEVSISGVASHIDAQTHQIEQDFKAGEVCSTSQEHKSSEVYLPKMSYVLSPLSINIAERSVVDDKQLGLDCISKLGARHEDNSDDFTSISDLDAGSDCDSDLDTPGASSVLSEGSSADYTCMHEDGALHDTHTLTYPHNSFVSVSTVLPGDNPNKDSYVCDIINDWCAPNYTLVNGQMDEHNQDRPYPDICQDQNDYYDYQQETTSFWWKQSLHEAIKYSHWLNNTHLSNYAQFCHQTYLVHKQYADHYEAMYLNAADQLEQLESTERR